MSASQSLDEGTVEKTTVDRVYWRLVPLLFGVVFLAGLDRSNISFAALRMDHAIGLTPAMFGFGGSVFFFSYMFCGIPNNLIARWCGVNLWVAFMTVVCGIASCLFAYIEGAKSFYLIRFMLGIFEAGILPGLALYMTFWFPKKYRALAIGGYMFAAHASLVVGSPLAAILMVSTDHLLGLQGWRWMFQIEGACTIIYGFCLFFLLPKNPQKALWLGHAQRDWLQSSLDSEARLMVGHKGFRLSDVVFDSRVWRLGILFGCALVGIYGLIIWLPQIIRAMGHLGFYQVAFLSAVPHLFGALGVLVISYSADRTRDRKNHLSAVFLVASLLLIASAFVPNVKISYALLCVACFSVFSSPPLFWCLATEMMTGLGAVIAIPFINSIAQFGGLIGPWMTGLIKGETGNFHLCLAAYSGFLIVSALIAFSLKPSDVSKDHVT